MRIVQREERVTGMLLLELLVALTLLTVGCLAVMAAFSVAFRGIQETEDYDVADVALENVCEMLRGQVLESVYTNFHNTSFEVGELENADGGPAAVAVTCFTNEAAIPPEFGPLTDLDGFPGSTSDDVSSSYRLLPTRLRVDYSTPEGPRSREVWLVLGQQS